MKTLGLRIKTGLAVAVIVERKGDDVRIVARKLVKLADDGDGARFIYHAALDLPGHEGEAATRRLITAARRASAREMGSLLDEARGVTRAGIVVGSLVEPHKIAAAHMRAHALEGKFYREVVGEALQGVGIQAAMLLERDAYAQVAGAKGEKEQSLRERIAALGNQIKPWRAEEKLAALAAYSQLSMHRCG